MATPAEKNTKDETEDYRDSVREICAGQHRVTVRCHVDGLRRDSAERFRQQYIPPCEPVRVPLGKPVSLSELAKLISRLAHFSGREIEPLGIIGKGSYSVVYKCFLLRANGVTEAVAVKRPRSRTINSLDNMTFMVEEGVIMQLANHRYGRNRPNDH